VFKTTLLKAFGFGEVCLGGGNWTFEFFNDNQLTIFTQKPDEGFTVNFPIPVEIKPSGLLDISCDLNDGTWVSHRIPIFPTYHNKEYKGVRGCIAILAIPVSEEAKQYKVWTGLTTSPLFELK
jgi:hypothetical protein